MKRWFVSSQDFDSKDSVIYLVFSIEYMLNVYMYCKGNVCISAMSATIIIYTSSNISLKTKTILNYKEIFLYVNILGSVTGFLEAGTKKTCGVSNYTLETIPFPIVDTW